VEFIEGLIRQWDPSGPASIWSKRVTNLQADPLSSSPIVDPVGWRRSRGLDPGVAFEVAGSGNLGSDRMRFYETYLPVAITCAKARLPGRPPWPDDELERFGQELFERRCPNWPAGTGLDSKEFVSGLLLDVVAALMSMQGIRSPRPFALLEAMNQNRRVGNRFTVAYADVAVAAFKRELDRTMGW